MADAAGDAISAIGPQTAQSGCGIFILSGHSEGLSKFSPEAEREDRRRQQ